MCVCRCRAVVGERIRLATARHAALGIVRATDGRNRFTRDDEVARARLQPDRRATLACELQDTLGVVACTYPVFVVTLRVRLDFIDLALFFDPDVWLRPGLRVFV